VAAELMGSVYWQLLLKLEREKFQVFGPERIRLGKAHKIWLILRSVLAHTAGSSVSPYGTL